MSGISRKLLGTTPAATGGQIDISEYFSTYLYTGNGSTQTITNGIDLAGEGGLVWTKSRSATWNNILIDTENGGDLYLYSNTTVGHTSPSPVYITSFNSDGYTISTANELNSTLFATNNYASWTFRKAPRFFDVVTYTGTGSARTIDHNLGQEVGCIIVKRTDTTADWQVYHRSLANTQFLVLNSTLPEATGANRWNSTAPTSSVFSVGTSPNVNASGGTYVAYLYAHDPLGPSGDGSDGLIACGSYTGNGLADGPEINLGWEPQWLLIKNASLGTENWVIFDVMRGLVVGTGDKYLRPNLSDAESAATTAISPQPNGFKLAGASGEWNGNGNTMIYIAIRRGPMRAPESGTEVFGMDDYTGGGDGPVSGFVTDMALLGQRAGTDKFFVSSRLTGDKYMLSPSTAAELSLANQKWDRMDGAWNTAVSGYMLWGFARAPEFFDVVAYTGDGVAGRTVPHNLGVAPELMIAKPRDQVRGWPTYWLPLGPTFTTYLNLTGLPTSGPNMWNSTNPSDTAFTIGNDADINASGFKYIAYLFSTLAGISKVGSYTGNGSSQTIDCGFTTGARFILIKQTNDNNDWYVWDTARGIVAANDPHLSLNTTAAEVTTDDSVEPVSSGFIVNQVAATNINVSAASYIFYAVS